MSKKAKNADVSPRDRFGQLYIAFQAQSPEARYQDVRQLALGANQQLEEIQQDFIFRVIHQNCKYGYAKFLFIYKLLLSCIVSELDRPKLAEIVVNKVSSLMARHQGYEYDYDQYVSDVDDVNFQLDMEGHGRLLLKEPLYANDAISSIASLQIVEDDPKQQAKGKGAPRRYLFQLSIDEAREITTYVLREMQSLELYRLVFDKAFARAETVGMETVSPVHLALPASLQPLQDGYKYV